MRVPRRPNVWQLALIFAVATLFAGCDWNAIGFDPGNTNFNPSEPALTESSVQHLKVAWSAPCACEQRALVAGGVVYVVDGFSGTPPFPVTVRAFDASSGKARWSTPLGAGDTGTELSVIANGLVYVLLSPSQRIVALDAATGVVRWQMTPPEPGGNPVTIAGPIIVDGPLAFVAAFARNAKRHLCDRHRGPCRVVCVTRLGPGDRSGAAHGVHAVVAAPHPWSQCVRAHRLRRS